MIFWWFILGASVVYIVALLGYFIYEEFFGDDRKQVTRK